MRRNEIHTKENMIIVIIVAIVLISKTKNGFFVAVPLLILLVFLFYWYCFGNLNYSMCYIHGECFALLPACPTAGCHRFESGFVPNIDFFEVSQFEFVSKIEGHKSNNGTCHEKYYFTDRQCDLTNESGSVQASFFLSSLAMVRSTL